MTAPEQTPQPIRFQGATSATANDALEKILKQSKGSKQLIGKALRTSEGDNGLSVTTFIQNNMVALLPKWIVSRSPLESAEFSFLEVAESSLLYFILPIAGNRVFQPLFKSIAKKEFKTLAEKEATETGIKAATILSTFGVTLVGGEFMTHYVKNLMTAKVFKKDRFSDIVNLSQGQMNSDKPSDVVQKCEKRIKQCLAACVGILGASFVLAKGGASAKENIFTKSVSKSANFLEKHLDFAKGKDGKLCLSPRQMRLYMALAVFAYMDSARDKLERVETASRLALILPYLAFGQGALKTVMLKSFPKYFESIVSNPAKHEVYSLRELADKAMKKAEHNTTKASQNFADPLKRKAVLMGVPLAFGIFGTGIGVGLLNRFWTQYRFNQQQKEQQLARRNQASPALPSASLPIAGTATAPPPARLSLTSSPFPIQPAMASYNQLFAPLPNATQAQPNFRYPFPNSGMPANPVVSPFRG